MSLDIVDAITGCFDLMEIVFSKVRKLTVIFYCKIGTGKGGSKSLSIFILGQSI